MLTIPNLRHLRAFCEVAKRHSISRASREIFLSQPAVTQAIAKLEAQLSIELFSRRSDGMFATAAGLVLLERVNRALDLLCAGTREATRSGTDKGARVCLLRLGVVFGPAGGALPELVHNVRRLHAGRLGSGRQWMSWIHREDVVAGIRFLLERPELSGPFNFAAPEPRRQADVAHTLGRLLDCHHLVPAPLFAVRLKLGEAAELAQFSQRAVPRRLLEAGFRFQHPLLEPALQGLLAAMP